MESGAARRGLPDALWQGDDDWRRPLTMPSIRVVRFYKMDHLGDPILLRNGRIRLGVEDCKYYLRAGIKQSDLERRDNLIISIGGITAKDGLSDRLTWGGIPVERQDDGSIDCEDGYRPLASGPLVWRENFPRIADYIDTVNQWHRVGRMYLLKGELARGISPSLCREFISLFEWGKGVVTNNKSSRHRSTVARLLPQDGCPPASRKGVCPSPRKGG